jgi:hypothetical protein
MFFSRDWLSTTIEEFVAALDAYIHWYNRHGSRCHLASAALPGTEEASGSLSNQSKFLAAPPPRRPKIEPGVEADFELVGCG